jgi:hypothetical protein
MSALSPPVWEKLAKVLPLLGSNEGGERDAAALAAHRILTKAGLSWDQILAGKPSEHREPLIGMWLSAPLRRVDEAPQHPPTMGTHLHRGSAALSEDFAEATICAQGNR